MGIDVFKIAFNFTCDIKVKKFPILLKIFNYFVKPSVKTSAVKRDLYLALDEIKISVSLQSILSMTKQAQPK